MGARKERQAGARALHGRDWELAMLRSLLAADAPDVLHLSGSPGVGKSALLAAFAAEEASRGRVHLIDCRTVESTASALRAALRVAGAGPQGWPGAGSVLCLDHYEHFLLLDA